MKLKNFINQKRYVKNLISQAEPYSIGHIMIKLNTSGPMEDIEDIFYLSQIQKLMIREKYVIAVYLPQVKKRIWIDKLNSSDVNILTTKLLKILDQGSTSNEKGLTPFWTQQSKEISQKLWLPTKIDYVDSVLTSSNESLRRGPMGRSWFSIKKIHPQKKSSLKISSLSPQFFLQDYMVSGATKSNKKSKTSKSTKTTPKKEEKLYKTLKFRLFPTDEEKEKLKLSMDQHRWYYNATVSIIYKQADKDKLIQSKKLSNKKVRDTVRKYEFEEEIKDNKIIKKFIYNKDRQAPPIPKWWDKVHNRIPRGASEKFTSSINSAITNFREGNILKFDMGYKSRKSPTDNVYYEDKGYPSYVNKIRSHYWYRTKEGRKTLKIEDILHLNKGCEIIHDKLTNKFYLHYPVDINWLPTDDIRNDKQVRISEESNRVVSLDPGVRKFMVCYDPEGSLTFVADKAHKKLMSLLLVVDKIVDRDTKLSLWRKIKNLVSEMHWKTANYLITNYDTILLPRFRVQQMIKGRKLRKKTKRLMTMYSFYKFEQILKFKAKMYNKKVVSVEEDFTSKTCTNCGKLNDVKGSEVYKCKVCNIIIDRDVNGSRNILIKNLKHFSTLE